MTKPVQFFSAENQKPAAPRIQSQSEKDKDKFRKEVDDGLIFLTKAITLQSQNPLKPMKPGAMLGLMKDFTHTEQMVKQSAQLEELNENLKSFQLLFAGGLGGQSIELEGNTFSMPSTSVEGDIPAHALASILNIYDELGTVVHTEKVDKAPGHHKIQLGHLPLPANQNYTYRLHHFMPGENGEKGPEFVSGALPVHLPKNKQTLAYAVPQEMATALIEITNAQGKVVRILPGKTEEGRHLVDFDHKDQLGNPLPAGVYQFQVKLTDEKGESIPAKTSVIATIDGVELQQGKPVFRHGNLFSPLSAYKSALKMLP